MITLHETATSLCFGEGRPLHVDGRGSGSPADLEIVRHMTGCEPSASSARLVGRVRCAERLGLLGEFRSIQQLAECFGVVSLQPDEHYEFIAGRNRLLIVPYEPFAGWIASAFNPWSF